MFIVSVQLYLNYYICSVRITIASGSLQVSYFADLEKAMAPHSSTLAWKIPWMEEPGRLQSMGSIRVGHN